MAKKLSKGDALASLGDLIGKLREQASQGQIDGALLDQAGAIVDVAVQDNVAPSEVASEMAGHASGATEASSEPSGSMPDASGIAKGDASMPSSFDPSKSSDEETDEETEPSSEDEEPTMSDKSTVAKGQNAQDDLPAQGRPPIKSFHAPNLIFDQVDEMRAKLPLFMKAMFSGSVRQAQKIAGDNTIAFDAMLNMAQTALLTEGGWTSDNMQKLAGSAQVIPQNQLAKAITASSVPGIYLIRLAKLMLPVYAGMVNRIPASSPTGMLSNQATWKAQLGFGSIAEAAGFRTAEAGIGQIPPTSFLTFNAPFNDVAYSDSVTLKAIRAGQGYSDPLQISVIKSMAALLRLQERIILGSNYASIGAMGAVTASGSTTGGSLAAGSYIVGVSALTYEGWLTPSKGVAASGSVAGESVPAFASVVVTTGATSQIAVSWSAVPGAVAYNVYLTASGSAGTAALWNKTVYTTKAAVTAASTGTTVPPTTDGTANALGIEGLLPWCENTTMYGNSIPNKTTITDLAGAGLTAANGGITQIDAVLASLATNWQTSPTAMVMSPNMANTLTGKILSLNSAATYRIDVSSERGSINGGMMVYGYVNKFFSVGDGLPKQLDVIPHPYMPDGTILMLSETIPYPMGNETRGFVRDVLLPYTYFPLASSTVQYNYSLTTSEVLEGFLPPAQTALVGIDYTL